MIGDKNPAYRDKDAKQCVCGGGILQGLSIGGKHITKVPGCWVGMCFGAGNKGKLFS